MSKKWFGTWPANCDYCTQPLKETPDGVFYDCKTRLGPWALLCSVCFEAIGCGLGTGKGQKYDSHTREKLEG